MTGEQSYAELAFGRFQEAGVVLRTQQTLEVGNTMAQLAPAYDLAHDGWSPAQRAEALETMEYAASYFATVRHGNIDHPTDKASNWVAILRGAELLTHLAARGDGDYGLRDDRITFLLGEIRLHLDQAFGDAGWNQEGWDYLNYGASTLAPVVRATRNAGLGDLDASWQRPRMAELALHTHSLRPTKDRLQFGVGERTGGPSAALLGTGTPTVQAAYRWLYERLNGATGGQAALVNWPEGVAAADPDSSAALRGALLDDEVGAYFFRDRFQGDDDTLIAVTNRNENHMGWAQPESFATSIIGQGTTWARQPAKENTNLSLFSKPLIDGAAVPPGTTPGKNGNVSGGRAYSGQGGGYVSLDARNDYAVDTARREQAVDLRSTSVADAVTAVHDRFADDTAHRIDWQLAPEPGVHISYGTPESGTQTFLFTRGDAWLKGWLLDPTGATMSTSNGAFRITRTGTSTDFKVVLAVGRGPVPTGTATGSALTLGQTTYDLADLDAFTPPGPAPAGNLQRPTVHLAPARTPFQPGATQQVTATYTWWHDQPATGVQLGLAVPTGWSAQRSSQAIPTTLRAGDVATATWDVTPPSSGVFGAYALTASGSAAGSAAIEDQAPAPLIRANLALARPAEQSSTQAGAEKAVDGDIDGYFGRGSVAHTLQQPYPWWQVDLGAAHRLGSLVLWNRVDCCADRLHDFYVLASQQPFGDDTLSELLARPDVHRHRTTGVSAQRLLTLPLVTTARYVRIQIDDATPSYLQLAEIQVLPEQSGSGHLAQGQPATQSTTLYGGSAGRAVDGNTDGAYANGSVTHTAEQVQPWWQTDLGESAAIGRIEIWNRTDCCAARLTDFYVLVSDQPFASGSLSDVLAQPGVSGYRQPGTAGRPTTVAVGKGGRYVRVQLAGTGSGPLSLAEVRVVR
ncbi:discoidin domain-containing protein [Streptomyces sp. NPDC047981]|uniref:galactose-binding domain-containing protein n=1 Tax=Streptomyces sp. NPDC047981 TaxID=3154610 RepID=UPI00342181E1